MEHQNQILQTLRAPESQARLERIVAQEALNNRAAVGRRVCAEFGFVDARGSAQLAGCLKALNTLHKAGRIALPASRGGGGAPTPQRFDAPVAAATAVPGTVEAVAGLSLERVEQGGQRRVWNTLLHFEHPQGTTTFAGCQVRYLVVSAHGVLGAVGFSASALQLRAREAWMGWSAGQRLAHLHRVLCLSRFLIRPGVQCRNLASQVLGQVLARLPADFEARYRYRPWLVETFVGPAHDGASFKAANFVWVGHTAGRGRQDRDHARARPVKAVYMYELEPHWRRRLGVARVDAAPALAPADGLDSGAWTVNEFGGAPLGDQRLSARLVKSAGLLASLPGEAVTANASHDRAAVKGYYRLIDQPVSSAVTPGNILAPHRARTLQRMRGQDTVLWCARLTGEGQPVEVRRKEGVTNHFRPESCAGRCEAAGEALTGARTGRAIEHRKRERLERRDCHSGRRQHRHHRNGEGMAGSTVSENPCTFVRPSSGPGRSSFCPGSRTGAAAGRRIPYPMMYGMKKSDEAIVCARQRNGQEGSRMRGAVSKGGGNASPAAGGRYGDTYTGSRRKPDTAKVDLTELRRTGRPSRGGVRRVCGAVPGRSRGGGRTGRPKVGQGRACTMEAKALSSTHRTKVYAEAIVCQRQSLRPPDEGGRIQRRG